METIQRPIRFIVYFSNIFAIVAFSSILYDVKNLKIKFMKTIFKIKQLPLYLNILFLIGCEIAYKWIIG